MQIFMAALFISGGKQPKYHQEVSEGKNPVLSTEWSTTRNKKEHTNDVGYTHGRTSKHWCKVTEEMTYMKGI